MHKIQLTFGDIMLYISGFGIILYSIERFNITDLNEKLYKIEKFLSEIGNEDLNNEDKNELCKTIIDKTFWIRDNNDIYIIFK